MRVDGAVADRGGQLTIIPLSRLRAGKINLCDVKAPKVDLWAANGAKDGRHRHGQHAHKRHLYFGRTVPQDVESVHGQQCR